MERSFWCWVEEVPAVMVVNYLQNYCSRCLFVKFNLQYSFRWTTVIRCTKYCHQSHFIFFSLGYFFSGNCFQNWTIDGAVWFDFKRILYCKFICLISKAGKSKTSFKNWWTTFDRIVHENISQETQIRDISLANLI